MNTPRVLFVSHTGAVSGAERVLLDVVQVMPDASAFVFEDGQLAAEVKQRGVAVHVAKQAGSLAGVKRSNSIVAVLPLMGRLAGLVRELSDVSRQYDVIYANSQKAFTLSALACGLSRRPLIWHLHDILSSAHFGAKQRKMQIFLANRQAKCVIVPSKAAAEAFIEAGGRKNLTKVVPNGVTLNVLPIDRARLRLELGLPDQPIIGVFSRLAPWKGQEWLLRALARLEKVSLIVVGDTLFGEQAYGERLKALTSELNLEDRVRFLGQRSDVPQLMSAMDAVIHSSIEAEPFGLTLVEAMLAKAPIIASDAGAAREILDNSTYGKLVPPGDVDALAKAISDQLLTGRSLVEAAFERAQSFYSAKKMQGEIFKLIEDVAGGVTL